MNTDCVMEPERAAEGRRSPRPGGNAERPGEREVSWKCASLWRFLNYGETKLATGGGLIRRFRGLSRRSVQRRNDADGRNEFCFDARPQKPRFGIHRSNLWVRWLTICVRRLKICVPKFIPAIRRPNIGTQRFNIGVHDLNIGIQRFNPCIRRFNIWIHRLNI